MTLVGKYRRLFDDTMWLEAKWRGFFGRATKFPRSFGELTIDTDVDYGQGRIGILLLLLQQSNSTSPDQALIGIIESNGHPGEPVTHFQRCALNDVHPVSSHGGRDDEAEPSQS